MTENFGGHYRAGFNFFKNKDYQKAIDSFLIAKKLESDQGNIYFYLGESYLKIGDIKKAIQAFTIGLLRCPNDIEIKNALVQIIPKYTPSNKDEEALRNEIILHPEDSNNYFELACYLQEKSAYSSVDEIIELFENIIQLFPQITDAYMLICLSYDDKGMIDEAIEISEKAVRIDPNYREIDNILYHLEKEYKLKGNFSEMIQKYQTLLRDEKNKADISYHFALAEAYFNKGDLLSAKEEYTLVEHIHIPFYQSHFFQHKTTGIDEKIKRIKNIHERVNQFDREMRKFIGQIYFKNNRQIYEKIANSELFDKIQGIIQTEVNKKPYLKKDDLNPLDYFTIFDYYKLIEMNWDIFDKIFQSKKKLNQNIEYINDFRNQIAHNRIVDDPSIEFCIAALSWFDKIFNQEKM